MPRTTSALHPATPSSHQRRFGRALAACALGLGLLAGGAALPTGAQAGIIGGGGAPEAAVAAIGEGQTITVSGTGTVRVAPDKASLSFSVQAESVTAAEATQAAGELADAVSAALEGAGVPKEEVQTGGVRLSPTYSYDEKGSGTASGYVGYVDYTVTDVAVGDVADVLGAAIDAGVTQTGPVQYYASDYDEAYQQALAKALAQARGKAVAVASALEASSASDESSVAIEGGASLVVLKSVTEADQTQQYRYADGAAVMSAKAAADTAGSSGAVASSTEPGLIDVEAYVSCEYAYFGAYGTVVDLAGQGSSAPGSAALPSDPAESAAGDARG